MGDSSTPVTHSHENRFDLDTGVLCLDFANTLYDRAREQPEELLRGYDDVVTFSRLAGTLSEAEIGRLAAEAAHREDEAAATTREAVELREAIFGVFSAIAAERVPDAGDLEILNRYVARSMARGRIVRQGDDTFAWDWDDDPAALDRPLWPVARSAADLLLTGDLRRVRECAADDCGWLFLDTSRNASRRWCSMKSCGNRAKVHQFRERQRTT